MNVDSDLQQELKLKTALFDTCVLSIIMNNIKNPDIQDFLDLLKELKCDVGINDLIKLEFMRDANNRVGFIERDTFINELCVDLTIPIPKKIYKDAAILSYIYIKYKCKGIELVDLMTSAFLNYYSHKDGLVLVTTNHKDFPLKVHDRIGTHVFDLGKDLVILGFYRVNPSKWCDCVNALIASPEWKEKE